MSEASTRTNVVEIIRITPPILEKGLIWFEKNRSFIQKESRKITSWWNANYKELVQDEVVSMSALMRELDEWGYIKVSEIRNPGELANHGGILDIFPPNRANAVRIEFLGNKINSIIELKDIKNEEREKELKKIIPKKPELEEEQKSKKERDIQKMLDGIREGTYVVHVDHGIARFREIEQSHGKSEIPKSDRAARGRPRQTWQANSKFNEKHLLLEYAEGDKLRVPISVAHKITPYIGFKEPYLTRLGGNLWEKTKRKVKEDLIKTAKELAKLYAEREITYRPPYNIDKEVAEAVEKNFPHQETKDQELAIKEIQKDLTSQTPMDRVIAGDVGFGKTEVALRAAAYAVSAGFQVALVAPTTILAHQHFKTFEERFEKSTLPVKLRKLTRIESRSEQENILKEIKEKNCDIVIGTHRLLQKDIEFSNLGLLIIDEEQRFGVKQKEYLKKKRPELDILSLSATPIPRTLYFALSGIRDISTINTPPYGKKTIKTTVTRNTDSLLQKAIRKELERKGQVYILHNRITSISKARDKLQEIVPEAKISYLHAKLPEKQIIDTIEEFSNGDIDVLVTTTLMENGLDLKNVNTLIVDDATKLGLAQAHQIRGRIGRGDRQAYAYFLYPSQKLKDKAKDRLQELENAQYLGAGYEIALRDLELRGAGNMLGKEQSGNIAKVGFNLYLQLLNEAIEELRSSRN